MSLLERSNEKLKEQLLTGNTPCNYKLLSRQLDIHVNDAKKLLYTFYTQHKDLVEATYVILGQLRDSEQKLTIKITKDLDDCSLFEQVDSVQVYALSAKGISPDEISQMTQSEINKFDITEEKMQTWGMIKGPDVIEVERSNSAPTTTNSRLSTTTQSSSSNTKAPSIMDSMKSRPKNEESKQQKKPDPFANMGLESERILAKYRKQEQEPEKKDTQQTIGKSFAKKASKGTTDSKTQNDAAMETIEDEDLNDEEYIKKQERLKTEKARKQKLLESMFDDDDDDQEVMDVDDDPKVETNKKEATPQPPKEESQSKHADLADVFDSSFSQSQSQSQKKGVSDHQEPTSGKTEEEVETYVDEDGFIVTKSKPKAKTTSSSKPRARTSSITTSNTSTNGPETKKQKTSGSKSQSSLMSFFGKKK